MNEHRRRPPPLTAAQLQELNHNLNSETGRRLLWEIPRLRALVLPAHHLAILVRENQRMYNDPNVRRLVNALRAQLDCEPAIQEELDKKQERHDRKHALRL
jgi:hypothetical protein